MALATVDKQKDFKFAGPFEFTKVTAQLEESEMRANDTCGFVVRVTNGSSTSSLDPVRVNVSRAATPAGGTVQVIEGQGELGPIAPGVTIDSDHLVRAGTNPRAYDINVRVILNGLAGNPDFDQTFKVQVPEQKP